MGITIGDALVTVGLVAALCGSAWGTSVAITLLYPSASKRAVMGWRLHLGRTFIIGLLGIFGVVLVLALAQVPNPLVKLISTAMLGAFLCVIGLGLSGLSGLLAERIQEKDPHCSDFAAISRGTLVAILASALPIVGWLCIGPLVLVLSMGAGLLALLGRKSDPVEVPHAHPTA